MPGEMCHDVLSDTYLLLHICGGKEQGCPAHDGYDDADGDLF
jgi:hypothetical protein